MKHYFKNPRQITQKQIKDLEYSLLKFGDLSGIVHDLNSDEIIGGNQRMEIFGLSRGIIDENIRLDETYETPDAQGTVARGKILWKGFEYTYRQVKWDPRMCEEANIRANHDGGSFDYDILANQWELDDLLSYGFEKAELGMGGFNFDEPVGEDPGPQIDKAEELREKWQVETGQLWRLGEHRIICGDSTDGEIINRLMDGENANMICTDPIYGVDYSGQSDSMYYGKDKKGKSREKLEGDNSPIIAGDIITRALTHIKTPILFLWCAPQFHDIAKKAVSENGYEVFSLIVWNKNHANFGAMGATYKPKFEMALACKRDKIPFYGPDNEVTVWDIDRASKNEFHPTQKPIELFERSIRNHTRKNEIVIDLFLGGGSTLIACERLSRKCRGSEKDPAYIAVTIQRWVDMTGGTPELMIEENSNTVG